MSTGFLQSFHWNLIENLTQFPMDFYWYSIELSTGFPITSIVISLKFPLVYHLNFNGLTIDPTGYPLELLLNSNWISNGLPLVYH